MKKGSCWARNRRASTALVPLDRRRFYSLPGGTPARDHVERSSHRALIELAGDDVVLELTQQLIEQTPALLDLVRATRLRVRRRGRARVARQTASSTPAPRAAARASEGARFLASRRRHADAERSMRTPPCRDRGAGRGRRAGGGRYGAGEHRCRMSRRTMRLHRISLATRFRASRTFRMTTHPKRGSCDIARSFSVPRPRLPDPQRRTEKWCLALRSGCCVARSRASPRARHIVNRSARTPSASARSSFVKG